MLCWFVQGEYFRDFLKGDICQFITTIHGKVMFSQASAILFTGGVCGRHPQARLPPAQCMLGHTHTDTPAQCMLGYTSPRWSPQRKVRILLECILVCQNNFRKLDESENNWGQRRPYSYKPTMTKHEI